MNDNIKPCPFCGSDKISTLADMSQGSKWGWAYCCDCLAQGPEVRTGYDTREGAPWRREALNEWNTRPEKPLSAWELFRELEKMYWSDFFLLLKKRALKETGRSGVHPFEWILSLPEPEALAILTEIKASIEIDKIINTPDEEILKQVEDEHGDPNYEANKMKAIIKKAEKELEG